MSESQDYILGSYRLIERIGKGGMGEVYRAQHLKLGREAAVKVLPANLAGEADFLKRFEREAASAASLEHPNILAVWDYGEQAGTPYLVMPYVRGGTLKELLQRGGLSRAEMLKFLQQMADALDYAHGRGLIHRDVKPANMLVDDRNHLYLSDFGIAKALEGSEGLTRTGVGVGTPEYMAPEQAQGRADKRSDLYALGVILYQMLTGRVPYSGNSTVEVLMAHMQEALPLMPIRNAQPPLPGGLERVLQRALAKNPNERYQSGANLVEAVTEALAGGSVQSYDATMVGQSGSQTLLTNLPSVGDRTSARVDPVGPGVASPTQVGGVAGQGYTAPPPGHTPAPGGFTPPPQGYTPPPGGFTPPPQGYTPPPGGFTPPPQGYTPPPPGYTPAPPGYTAPPAAYGTPPAGYAAQASRPSWIIPAAVGGILLLLLLGGGGVFAATRPDSNATATAGANATSMASMAAASTGTAQVVAQVTSTAGAAATATANAPTATVPPTATTAPTATRPLPTPTKASAAVAPTPTAAARATQAPTVNGAVPAGWKVYNGGAKLPFVVAYPPDWRIDDSQQGRIYFSSPADPTTYFLVGTTGTKTSKTIDELRNDYFTEQFSGCKAKAVDVDRYNKFSGITFASVGTTCDWTDGKLYYSYIGLGLLDQVPWRFRLNSLYADYDGNIEKYFKPMLASLNIYGNP